MVRGHGAWMWCVDMGALLWCMDSVLGHVMDMVLGHGALLWCLDVVHGRGAWP